MTVFNKPEFFSPEVLFITVLACAATFPFEVGASCTWKFDWYCSDCAKIGGRTTGEQGGYSSEAACEAARSSIRQPVTPSSSCDRVGWCDEPAKPQPASPLTKQDIGNRSLGGRAYSPTDSGHPQKWEEKVRREEEARAKAAAARKEREREAFEKAKSDLLGGLKGSTLDRGRGLKGANGGGTLKLKSGTPTFGLKGNPSGDLRLKDPSAVKLKNPETASVNPAFFTRPTARLRIRSVPNPMEAPKWTWLRYVRSSRAGLILDALEEGRGDLDRAIG